ncbi:hypothetical protein JCM18899A_39970 [Nocardioides sp. AN3]
MSERPGERTATRVGGHPAPQRNDDTAARPGFAQQLKERLSAAADEFRAQQNGGQSPMQQQKQRQGAARTPRRARLRLTRIDPWSVMKTAFLLSIALGVVTIVSVFIVWSVLGAAGVWDSINKTVQDIVGDTSTFDITNYIGMSRVMGFTMIVSVIDVILMTAVGTLGAFLYNMAAALLGGIDVTLTEDR